MYVALFYRDWYEVASECLEFSVISQLSNHSLLQLVLMLPQYPMEYSKISQLAFCCCLYYYGTFFCHM